MTDRYFFSENNAEILKWFVDDDCDDDAERTSVRIISSLICGSAWLSVLNKSGEN